MSATSPTTAAPTAVDRLSVTDTLRNACGDVEFGDLGIEILIAAFEADRLRGMPKSQQFDLGIVRCRENEGTSLDTDCLSCVAAIVDQVYGP